jgi:hypothetical protein
MVDSFDKERRKGNSDRRRYKEDRRNAERVADDPVPRRDPDRNDRRNPPSSTPLT